MQKRRLYLISLLVMILAAVSFGSVSFAAEVTRMNTHKGHIYINEGVDAGFVMGAEVCFFSSSGEEIVCGKVRRATDAYAMVEVNNRKAKKIKNGMQAELSDHKTEKEKDSKEKQY